MGWAGGLAEWIDGDTAFLSVAFSWKLPDAYQRAAWYKVAGYKVKAGGPGLYAYPHYLDAVAEIGEEYPDAIIHHNPDATKASKGCPVGCYFCIVPKAEGKSFTYLSDFTPRPILCDNNLSALPADYQDFIIDKYRKSGVKLLDANSGFEPLTFTDSTYARWKSIYNGVWRFGFDETGEEEYARKMAEILKKESPRKKIVYVLIGNEPFEACMIRIQKVLEWNCEPHVQPMIAINALVKRPIVKFDWTEDKLRHVARWANRRLWRKITFSEYRTDL